MYYTESSVGFRNRASMRAGVRHSLRFRKGDISVPVALVVFFGLLALGIVIFMSSARQVVQTKADIENIAQGDTVLFAMLESGICAPATGLPLKYDIGVWLTYAAARNDIVSVNYNGNTETITISDCIRRFLQSVKTEAYQLSVTYNGHARLTVVPLTGPPYDASKPKKTEKIYVSVPDSSSRVAEVVLDMNLPERGDKVCPEKEEAHFCTPRTYCLLSGRTCSKDSGGKDYLCGGATCCCK